MSKLILKNAEIIEFSKDKEYLKKRIVKLNKANPLKRGEAYRIRLDFDRAEYVLYLGTYEEAR